jgi:glycerol-3-phosphate acyltransferase PlsY
VALGWLLFTVVMAYLIGAIPFGFIVGQVFFGVDVRQYGSQRTGATNVLRTFGPGASAVVLLADALKGVAVVLFARSVAHFTDLASLKDLAESLSALVALAGHNWPVYVGFRGGRGVAVGTGSMIVLLPVAALIGIGTALGIIAVTRIVSLGSVIGAILSAVLFLIWTVVWHAPAAYLWFAFIGATTIVLQHRDNIVRLRNGTERRLGQRDAVLHTDSGSAST